MQERERGGSRERGSRERVGTATRHHRRRSAKTQAGERGRRACVILLDINQHAAATAPRAPTARMRSFAASRSEANASASARRASGSASCVVLMAPFAVE